MQKDRSLITFFRYLIVGFLISSVKNTYTAMDIFEVINTMFLSFLFNFIVGIWTGLAGLFGTELYFYIKKNLKNEGLWDICRVG